MKKLFFISILLILFYMNTSAQTSEKQWFDNKEWLSGLQLTPHKTVNITELARQYQLNKKYWDKAFTFLKDQDLQTLEVGKVLIDGDSVYAMITQNRTKDFDSTKWESHKKYVDLQYVISGKEKIGVTDIKKLKISIPYDETKDLVNYSGTGNVYIAEPRTFFLFFPSDAHRPNITPGGNEADKKIVIKIKYSD